jgi:hypothetical protein
MGLQNGPTLRKHSAAGAPSRSNDAAEARKIKWPSTLAVEPEAKQAVMMFSIVRTELQSELTGSHPSILDTCPNTNSPSPHVLVNFFKKGHQWTNRFNHLMFSFHPKL